MTLIALSIKYSLTVELVNKLWYIYNNGMLQNDEDEWNTTHTIKIIHTSIMSKRRQTRIPNGWFNGYKVLKQNSMVVEFGTGAISFDMNTRGASRDLVIFCLYSRYWLHVCLACENS